jgi:hypothetical protein
MRLKNKIPGFYNIGKEYFIIPFCFSIFITSIIIYSLRLHLTHIRNSSIFYIGLILGFSVFLIWFKKLEEKNRIKDFINELSSPLFLMSLIIITLSSIHIFLITQFLQLPLLFASIMSGSVFFLKNINVTYRPEPKNLSYFKISIPIIISLAGLILRLNNVGNLSFWFDESISVLIGQRISQGYGDTFLLGTHYNRAVLYHYLLGLFLKIPGNIFFLSRLVNVLFYIPTCILIYIWSKKYFGYWTACLALFFFTISSFNIAMFREARFYELFNLVFLATSYCIFELLEKYIQQSKIINQNKFSEINLFIKNNKLKIFITLVLSIILIKTSEISAYILYPIILIFAYLLIIHKKIIGLFLAILSFIILLVGLIVKYSTSFQIYFLIKQPQLSWKARVPDRPFLDFITYITQYEYGYLYIIFILLIPFLIFKVKKFKLYYIFIILFSLFTIISIQGYGILTIRYYYILTPFIAMLFGLLISKYLTIFKATNKLNYLIFFVSILIIMFSCTYYAVSESASIVKQKSIIDVKNNNFKEELEFIKKNINFNNSIIVSDIQSSIPFYLFFNRRPDYLLAEDKKIEFLIDNKDIYLGTPILSYLNLPIKDKKTYLILWYSPAFTIDELIPFLNTYSTLIYREGAKRIYLLN